MNSSLPPDGEPPPADRDAPDRGAAARPPFDRQSNPYRIAIIVWAALAIVVTLFNVDDGTGWPASPERRRAVPQLLIGLGITAAAFAVTAWFRHHDK